MATITTTNENAAAENRLNPLNRVLTGSFVLNWEVTAYLVIFVLAVFTRFYLLGDRVMSHDESLHVRYSYNLYSRGDFQHTPLMHGPVIFHAVALSYFLFGDNDFTSRIYPAVLGIALVMFPILFRRWLGRWGALLASIGILISPLLMYYSRYIREDIPSIFFSMVMIYCILMYLAGPENQRHKPRWLYIFSGATLLSLASKEVGFFYVAIMGSFLLLYWLVRLAQHYWQLPGKPIFYTLIIAILLGGVASLGMYVILDIVPPATANAAAQAAGWFNNIESRSFIIWTIAVVVSVVAVTVGTLVWVFRDRLENIPWRELAIVIIIAVVTCLALIVLEEVSHIKPDASETAQPVVPGQTSQVVTPTLNIRWWPMVAVWIVGGLAVALFVYSRLAGWWESLRRFPELDVLMVTGSLVLPWLAAVVPWFMKGSAADYTTIGQSLPAPLFDFVSRLALSTSPEMIARVFIGFLALVPLLVVSVVAGLVWNWRHWVVCALVFYSLFAFFFTTMFTNMQGLGTGMVYSLGYWLEQQGVRRGSQPQYYYLVVIMPFYEFLPVIGSMLAMVAGMVLFWRSRRTQLDRRWEMASLLPDEKPKREGDEAAPVGEELPSPSLDELVGMQAAPPGKILEETGQELSPLNRAALRWTPYLFVGAIIFNVIAIILDLMTPGGPSSTLWLKVLTVIVLFFATISWWARYMRPRATVRIDGSGGLMTSGELGDDEIEQRIAAAREDTDSPNALERLPFLLFISWWSILNLVVYTLAGEKMPWLGTHLTTPLIFLAAWYLGGIISKIDFRRFLEQGWLYLLLFPLLFIALFQTIFPFVVGQSPFGGLQQQQLQQTQSWFAYVAVGGIVIFAAFWLVERTGWIHLRQMLGVSTFAVLGLLSFRSAWVASFINYDYATEFLVYAHGAPAIKRVLSELEELSLRTTDGMDLRFVYDDRVSWPYSWYFRHFKNAVFVGSNPTFQSVNNAAAVVVGGENRAKVEPLLEDRYIHFEFIRLWWPMQDYFGLTGERVANTFDFSPENTQAAQIRQGIFNIWWSRDYSTYGSAVQKDFSVTRWPVADRMHFYVRKDIAAQVWPYGIGNGGVAVEEAQPNQCNVNWQQMPATLVFDRSQVSLNRPLGIAIGTDGKVYVAEEYNFRVSVFDQLGNFQSTIGQQGGRDAAGVVFNRPNAVAVAPNNNLYIADTWNYRIVALSPSGELITRWGQPGEYGFEARREPVDGFWGPRAVAIDQEGLVYVSDTGNKRIRVYSANGQFLRDIGSGGSGLGQLDEPSGLAIHPDGRLFVADTWNRRVSVFRLDGTFLTDFTVRGWYEEQGNRPYLAIDPVRNLLYVTDPDAGRVLVYDTNGACLGSFGQLNRESPNDSQFATTGGIAVDADGNVYVSDAGSGRVLKFAPFVAAPAQLSSESSEGIVLEATSEILPGELTPEITPEIEQTKELDAVG